MRNIRGANILIVNRRLSVRTESIDNMLSAPLSKMIPILSSSLGNRNFCEFQKLPYNPKIFLKQETQLESLRTALERLFYFVEVLFKSVPIWFVLLEQWLNPPPQKSIVGWNALVTGGSNGIGRAVCTELAKSGCNVIIVDTDAANGVKVVQKLLKYRIKAIFYQVDVSDFEAIEELGRRVERDFGPVDILVNNAGLLPFLVQDSYSSKNIQQMMNFSVLSQFWTIKTFLPGMYARCRGHIVDLSSWSAYFTAGYNRNFPTTNYTFRGFIEDLHDEIYHSGYEGVVNTTSVFPALINTRKETIDTLPRMTHMAVTPTKLAARQIVEGIRTNKRKMFIPNLEAGSIGVSYMDNLPALVSRAVQRLKMSFREQTKLFR